MREPNSGQNQPQNYHWNHTNFYHFRWLEKRKKKTN